MANNKFQISIEGLRELRLNLKKYGDGLEPDIDAVLNANALEIQRNAKRRAPKRKKINTDSAGRNREAAGTLQGSITVGKLPDRLGYEIGTNVQYAAYMEFGTGNLAAAQVAKLPTEFQELALQYKAQPRKRLINIPAQPYLYPSYRDQLQIIVNDLNDILEP